VKKLDGKTELTKRQIIISKRQTRARRGGPPVVAVAIIVALLLSLAPAGAASGGKIQNWNIQGCSMYVRNLHAGVDVLFGYTSSSNCNGVQVKMRRIDSGVWWISTATDWDGAVGMTRGGDDFDYTDHNVFVSPWWGSRLQH